MPSSILCRISPYRGEYRILFRTSNDRIETRQLTHLQLRDIAVSILPSPSGTLDPLQLGHQIFAILFAGFDSLLEEAIESGRREVEHFTRVLLELGDADLERIPWELGLFGARNASDLEIIRWRPSVAQVPAQLPTLPLRVLFVEMAPDEQLRRTFSIRSLLATFLNRPEHLVEICQPVELFGVNRDDLRGALSQSRFDIIHMHVTADWLHPGAPGATKSSSEAMIAAAGEGPPLNARTLRPLLRRSQTRLLILHLQASQKEYLEQYQLAEIARSVTDSGGPGILIVPVHDPADRDYKFMEEFYASIIHDHPLGEALHRARQRLRSEGDRNHVSERPILTLRPGAEDLLRLSTLASDLIQRSNEQRAYVSYLHDRMGRLPAHPELQITRATLDRAHRSISGALESALNIHDWSRETGGLIPLHRSLQMASEGDSSLRTATYALEQAERKLSRVVNSCFVEGEHILPNIQPLGCSRHYVLRLQIGPRQPTSHVRNAQELPEGFLDSFYEGSELQLDISVHSSDFTVLEGGHFQLPLPRAGASKALDIPLKAPSKSCQARLRACVYYRQNLLQSLLVTAQVASDPGQWSKAANFADVEFSMADTFLDIERLPPRTVNVLTNERADGTHTFVVRGAGFEQQYSFRDSPAIKIIRERLLEACSELDKEKKPVKYRFSDADNSGNRDKLIADLKRLAPVGYTLYFDLVIKPANETLEDSLRSSLKKPGTIQISVTSSDNNVFPWAMVYDKAFVDDPGNIVCPIILERIAKKTAAGELMSHSCVDGGCSHANATNVICPFGFWGFRHAIEQLPSNVGDVVDTINVRGSLAFVMAVHQQLSGVAHRSEIETGTTIKANYCDAKKTIGEALGSTKPHFIYFYCHGGRTASTPWLGVGIKEQIQTTDFHAWDARWPDTRPIVFINGCHTVDLSPDDLLNFVTVFAWCRAAGVIGTEIAIPESLAREVGCHFIGKFLNSEPVASIIRDLRLSLLAKWNLLGLSYTPYCHGQLHLSMS